VATPEEPPRLVVGEEIPRPRPVNGQAFQTTGEDYVDAPDDGIFDVEIEDEPEVVTVSVDDYVDAKPLIEKPDRKQSRPNEPKSGPPNVAEWQDFFGRLVLRTLTNTYVTLMVGDLNLTQREYDSIKLTKEDLEDMSAPMAEVATKSKLGQKHGRKLMGMADSWEALAALVVWGARVRRIARKHKRLNPRPNTPVVGTVINREDDLSGNSGPSGSPWTGTGGPDDGGFHIYNPGTG
jgi:hypothetical protein